MVSTKMTNLEKKRYIKEYMLKKKKANRFYKSKNKVVLLCRGIKIQEGETK